MDNAYRVAGNPLYPATNPVLEGPRARDAGGVEACRVRGSASSASIHQFSCLSSLGFRLAVAGSGESGKGGGFGHDSETYLHGHHSSSWNAEQAYAACQNVEKLNCIFYRRECTALTL